MLFYIQHKDQEYQVRVESRNQKLYVSFNGEPEQEVDISFLGNDCWFTDNNQIFHANVVGQKDQYTIWRPEGNISLSVESEYRKIVGFLRGQEFHAENQVTAKMPGKITKLHVKTGDLVEKGTPLLVMEAMKMENEIRATHAGKVLSVYVSEGQAVESGAKLVELEISE